MWSMLCLIKLISLEISDSDYESFGIAGEERLRHDFNCFFSAILYSSLWREKC